MIKTDLKHLDRNFSRYGTKWSCQAYAVKAKRKRGSAEEGVLARPSVEVRCLAQNTLQIPYEQAAVLAKRVCDKVFLHKGQKGVSLHNP